MHCETSQRFVDTSTTGAPLLVTLVTFTIYVFADENNVLTAEKVFGTVAVFNVVRIPMNQFPRFLMESVKLFVSLRRIDDFLNCEDIEPESKDHVNESFKDTEKLHQQDFSAATDPVTFSNAYFSWSKEDNNNILNNLNLNIRSGELVAVVGKIGSGKSSLLSAILGEMVQVIILLCDWSAVSILSCDWCRPRAGWRPAAPWRTCRSRPGSRT